jgi:hypothetical protein
VLQHDLDCCGVIFREVDASCLLLLIRQLDVSAMSNREYWWEREAGSTTKKQTFEEVIAAGRSEEV